MNRYFRGIDVRSHFEDAEKQPMAAHRTIGNREKQLTLFVPLRERSGVSGTARQIGIRCQIVYGVFEGLVDADNAVDGEAQEFDDGNG